MQSIHIELLGPSKVSILDSREGGYGQVLIIASSSTKPNYAFKVIKPNIKSNESIVTEVKALSRLPAHPHVVEIERGIASQTLGLESCCHFIPAIFGR